LALAPATIGAKFWAEERSDPITVLPSHRAKTPLRAITTRGSNEPSLWSRTSRFMHAGWRTLRDDGYQPL